MASTSTRGSWFVQHKIISTVLVLLLVGWAFGRDGDEPAEVSDVAPPPGSTSASDPSETGRESDEDRGDATAEPGGEAKPAPKQPSRPKAKAKPRTFLVVHVVDGDTIDLANGESVRLVGIDTPERGECGYDTATANLARLVEGKRVRLTMSDEDRDRYGRLLRYVNVGDMDAGLRQIKSGWAIARYDSRDGYGFHPRENVYIATDKAVPDKRCPKPQPVAPAAPAGDGCAPGYSPCVPPYPPDVDCADVNGPITVTGSDPHGLDRDGDGIACE